MIINSSWPLGGEGEITTNSDSEKAWLLELTPGTRMAVEQKNTRKERWKWGGQSMGGVSTKVGFIILGIGPNQIHLMFKASLLSLFLV